MNATKYHHSQYELLKCGECGKTLGYIYELVKGWPFNQPVAWTAIEKFVFCEECFQKIMVQPIEELYRKLVDRYERDYGGRKNLERIINVYIKSGLSREDAIRKISREEGI